MMDTHAHTILTRTTKFGMVAEVGGAFCYGA